MDPTVTDSLKMMEDMIEVEEPLNVNPLKEVIDANCPEYFGYLADTIRNSIIPRKCLDCEKMDDCIKNNRKKNQ